MLIPVNLRKKLRKLKKDLYAMLYPSQHICEVVNLHTASKSTEVIFPSRIVPVNDPYLRSFLDVQRAVNTNAGQFQTDPVSVSRIEDAFIDMRTGIILDINGRVVLESSKNLSRLHVSQTWHNPKPRHIHKANACIATIHSSFNMNYFHWLVEALPRLFLLSFVTEPVQLLVPEDESELHLQTLNWCLPSNVTICKIQERWVQSRCLYFPSYLSTGWDFAYAPAQALKYISNKITRGLDLPNTHRKTDLIYISRANAHKRRLINEVDVVNCVNRFGFRYCELENMPFKNQVELFYNAQAVVGLHGAGFSNMVFSDHVRILEINSLAVNPVFFFLSLALGHDYRYLLPSEFSQHRRPSPSNPRLYSRLRDKDVSVNIPLLESSLESLLAPDQENGSRFV